MSYGYEEDDSEERELYEDEPAKCGCRLCFCQNTTGSGEVCSDCLADNHQG